MRDQLVQYFREDIVVGVERVCLIELRAERSGRRDEEVREGREGSGGNRSEVFLVQ